MQTTRNQIQYMFCTGCSQTVEVNAKFCGTCGAPQQAAGLAAQGPSAHPAQEAFSYEQKQLHSGVSQATRAVPQPQQTYIAAPQPAYAVPAAQNAYAVPQPAPAATPPVRLPSPPGGIPGFAQITSTVSASKRNKLHEEMGELVILLARERFFLYMHWLVFLTLNFIGCWIALKCYNEFIGDELSRLMVASTPFLFINSLALVCIVPIKGTRREIARLKERISYVKFKIEYGHLM